MKPSHSPPTCGVCGGPLNELFSATDRIFRTTTETFHVCVCVSCGVRQTVPQPPPPEMSRYYPAPYYPTRELNRFLYDRRIGRYQREKIRQILRFTQPGRLLDVGCGAGYFLREALARGFDARGIEFSDPAASVGRTRWGLSILTGDLLEQHLPDTSFDVITFWHSLEHVVAPAAALAEAHRLLCTGGLLAVAVPNCESIQARVFRDRWYHLEVPRHLYHFSPGSLAALLERCGFRVRATRFSSREHNWAGILGSVIRLSYPGEPFVRRALRKTAGRTVAEALALIESALHKGGTFQLFAYKR